MNLPGVDFSNVNCACKVPFKTEELNIKVTGKWFNYGIIFIVMILDANMLKNQILYEPAPYGQYTDPQGYIWTVTNDFSLELASHNSSLLSYAVRGGGCSSDLNRHTIELNNGSAAHTTIGCKEGDFRINARFTGYSLIVKSVTSIPVFAGLFLFVYLFWYESKAHR